MRLKKSSTPKIKSKQWLKKQKKRARNAARHAKEKKLAIPKKLEQIAAKKERHEAHMRACAMKAERDTK